MNRIWSVPGRKEVVSSGLTVKGRREGRCPMTVGCGVRKVLLFCSVSKMKRGWKNKKENKEMLDIPYGR